MGSLFLENLHRIATKTWFRLLLTLFLIYKSVFNVYSADYILPRLVESFTNAELEIDTKVFSLFFGLETNSIRLKLKNEFPNESIFEAKRLALRYNLLSLLYLKLKVSEIAIESGTLFLHERGGVWNFSRIAKATTAKPEPIPETSPPLEEIKTYLPLLAEAHINLDQFHLRYWKESEKRFLANVYDFNLRLDLITNRFTSLPLNFEILDQIDNFYLALNPNRSLPIEIDSEDINWKQTIPLSLLLDWKNQSKNPVFLFSSNIGSEQIQLEYKKKPIQFGLSLNHHVEYFPERDELIFKRFLLKILGDTWLSLVGNMELIQTPEPKLSIKVSESNIHLAPLSRLIGQLNGILPPISLNGDLSLAETSLEGKWSDILLKLKLNGNHLFFANGNGKKHNIKTVSVDANSSLDFLTKNEKTAKEPLPFVKSLNIEKLNLTYNEILLSLNASYERTKFLNILLNLENLNIGEFTSIVGGKAKAKIELSALDFSYLPLNLDLAVEGFRYAIDRSRSPYSRLSLSGNIGLAFDKPFGLSAISISNLNLLQKTTAGGKALGLDLVGSLSVSPDTTRIQTSKASVGLNLVNLLQTLPLVLKEKIAPLQSIVGNEPLLNLKSDITLNESGQKFKIDLAGVIPGLELKDLNVKLDASISKNKEKTITINDVFITAYQKIISLSLKGILKEKQTEGKAPFGNYFGSIDSKLKINSKEKKYLLKGISFMGNVDLTANIRDFDISGLLLSDHSHIHQTNQKCPGVDCRVFLVEDMEANIPFQHNLAWKKQESLIVGDKSVFIKTYGRTAEPNLKIAQVIGTHPSIPDLPFEYVKKQGALPGFSARIDYRENYATIDDLKAYSLDGLILGKNLVFNVGSGDPAFMEFRGNLQIRDIDLKQLMAPKIRDKIEDGKIKADLNISVRDLTEPVANMDLFFYIFQIGSDFGKSALNVISQQNLLIDRIADSYSVNKIDVSLSKGLVYADVFFRRSLLSIFVNLEDSKISQQRMPLANFLKRAQSEIQTYQ